MLSLRLCLFLYRYTCVHGQIWSVYIYNDKWRLKCRQKHCEHVCWCSIPVIQISRAHSIQIFELTFLHLWCACDFIQNFIFKCRHVLPSQSFSRFILSLCASSFVLVPSIGSQLLRSNRFFFLFCKWFHDSRSFPQNWLLQLFVLIYRLMST